MKTNLAFICFILSICLPYHQNVGQNHNLLTGNKFPEIMAEMKYSGTTMTNKIAFAKKLRDN